MHLYFRIQSEVRRVSNLWKSDLRSGLDVATFWIERVMKTKGPERLDYLKIQDGHLYWWQFYSLDILFMLFVAAITLRYAWIQVIQKSFKPYVEDAKKNK